MMLLATASFFACAYPLPFTWFFAWRFAAGIAGGVLMVLAALAVLPHVPAGLRGRVGGAIFSGVGLGVAASGTLVPLLMRLGLSETWISFGLLSLALTIVAWTGWPRDPPAHLAAEQIAAAASKPRANRAFLALCAEYALNAVGLVPHMVFLVDFVARGLGRGLAAGGFYWTIFGVGAVAGPLLTGAIADHVGFRRTLQASFLVQAAAVAAPAVSDGPSLSSSRARSSACSCLASCRWCSAACMSSCTRRGRAKKLKVGARPLSPLGRRRRRAASPTFSHRLAGPMRCCSRLPRQRC
jgi:predicted MFS family arabinose efflux permease